MTLPTFAYHPDPVATGSIVESNDTCICCGAARGFIYAGPVYAIADLDRKICPWCIADGSAHEKFDAEFTDFAGIGGPPWDKVGDDVRREVAYRTPGFAGWQQERWWTHCRDAAQFLGCVGYAEAKALGPQLLDSLGDDAGLEGAEREEFLQALSRDHGPSGYAFRCRHCGALGGYQDMD